MIELLGWTTGNTYRVLIALEEAALPYRVKAINLRQKEQHEPSFASLNSMKQVPVIIDDDGLGGGRLTLTQSTAILLYLAEKSGKLLPESLPERFRTLEALSLVMTDLVAPINFGLSMEREEDTRDALIFGEAKAMSAVSAIEKRLNSQQHLSGDDFGIADCAAYPMINLLGADKLSEFPATLNWYRTATRRPTVRNALNVQF